MDNYTWMYGKPKSTAVIKQSHADFTVTEILGHELDGKGEHLFLRVQKTGLNTLFVAEMLAKYANIPSRLVSYAGLKDKHAVTEQWFSIHLPVHCSVDFSQFQLEGCKIKQITQHSKKLRIGCLRYNDFDIIIRNITCQHDVKQRLHSIQLNGFPNYFGQQRFGYENGNIRRATLWAEGELIVKDRHKRSIYLSAARSTMFNHLVSERIKMGTLKQILPGDILQLSTSNSWFVAAKDELEALQKRVETHELFVTGVLPGYDSYGTKEQALYFEEQQLQHYPALLKLMQREKVKSMRRSMVVLPKRFDTEWLSQECLRLFIRLPVGTFATSLLWELVLLEQTSQE